MSKNRVKLNIAGYECAIISEESEGYIRSVGAEVDAKIREVMKNNSDISTLMSAILISMNFCDIYRKAIEKSKSIDSRVREYLEAATKAQVTVERLRAENEGLRKKISNLEIRMRSLEIKKDAKK